ncbi:anoctamin-9 isoform X1 [Manacus candei]|uniref:anoctamin-9 isoform X1 n=1 Tax=Manacus candei TaxID=415023 RepID=UPI0022267811|nr:anoctamin-9 isoform X1 [Manacus candei]
MQHDEILLTPWRDYPVEDTDPFTPPSEEKWDFVLVSDIHEVGSEKETKRKKFLDELSKKGFTIKKIEDTKLFYGVRAPEQVFRKYQCLLGNPDKKLQNENSPQDIPMTTRIRIVHFILRNTVTPDLEKLQGLMKKNVFEAAFPLHEVRLSTRVSGRKIQDRWRSKTGWERPVGNRGCPRSSLGEGHGKAPGSSLGAGQGIEGALVFLYPTDFSALQKEAVREFSRDNWARWRGVFNQQPIEKIRGYFGEKVALYFAWLGWYTYLLGFAALAGVLTFVTGITLFSSSQVSREICEANTTIMCPLCDKKCPYWVLSDTCTYAKVTHMIDNEATVLFAMFMALWATVFLELWKRQRATVVTNWNLYGWDEEEEELAMELINNLQHEPRKYQHSYFRSTIILLLVLLMILVLIGIAHALVIYRVIATALFAQSGLGLLREQADTMAVMTGAVLHYLTIVIMTKINRRVALFLCKLEKPRSFSQREKNFTMKIFTFQFFTNFSSLIYIAFFLGRINGRPGHYVRIAGRWRLEECHPSGCITDLFIQMAIIMLLKQTISNVMEYLIPWISHKLRKKQKSPKKRSIFLGEEEEAEDPCKRQWLKNYKLNEVNVFSLFDEFLEMMIQYSFTTIFVAAFPLAPLLAFFNNMFEIHLDAIKMVRLHRRMVPRRANDIGIWLQVLEAIGILAVIGNGLVIAITSDFIPMQVYKYMYSPCVGENRTDVDCSTGYINHSLSIFHIRDFEPDIGMPEMLPNFDRDEIKECRYRDYRNADDYSYTMQFWHVLAARLAFLIIFEHVALCVKLIAAWYIPDVPQKVKNDLLYSKHNDLRKELSTMEYSTEV